MKNKYEIRGDVTAIFVSSKKYGEYEFLIDTISLEEVSEAVGKWHVHVTGDGAFKYARSKTKKSNYKKWVYLHRVVTRAPIDKIVDHINHDTLDNRSGNLRLVTISENQQNRRGATRHNKSTGIRGVSWHKATRKWRVQVGINGVTHYIGCYSDIEVAERVSIDSRRKLFARLVEDVS